MTKAWQKFLLKLDDKTRTLLEKILFNIIQNNIENLDIKPLQWKENMFRCRVGKIRIMYSYKNDNVFIEDIGYRGNIYKGKK